MICESRILDTRQADTEVYIFRQLHVEVVRRIFFLSGSLPDVSDPCWKAATLPVSEAEMQSEKPKRKRALEMLFSRFRALDVHLSKPGRSH
jgi:hypothetical protein